MEAAGEFASMVIWGFSSGRSSISGASVGACVGVPVVSMFGMRLLSWQYCRKARVSASASPLTGSVCSFRCWLTHCWNAETALAVAFPYTPSSEPAGSRPRAISWRCTARMASLEDLPFTMSPLVSGTASVGAVVGAGVGVAVGSAVAVWSFCHSST